MLMKGHSGGRPEGTGASEGYSVAVLEVWPRALASLKVMQ